MNIDLIQLERNFDAPVDEVWQALTDNEKMKQWYFPDAGFKPEIGHVSEFNVHHEGKDFLHIWKVTEVKPRERIAYEWRYGGYPGNSLLSFDLTETQHGKAKVTLTHSKLNSFQPDQNPELSYENFVKGWTHFMDNGLKDFLKK